MLKVSTDSYLNTYAQVELRMAVLEGGGAFGQVPVSLGIKFRIRCEKRAEYYTILSNLNFRLEGHYLVC